MFEEGVREVVSSDNSVEWSIDHAGSNALVNHFKVSKDKRRDGVGSKVLTEIERGVVENGLDAIVVNMKGDKEAEKFLKDNGYSIVSNEDGFVTAEKKL